MVDINQLDGSSQPLAFNIEVPPSLRPYKLVVDGVYVGRDINDKTRQIEVEKLGKHKLRIDGPHDTVKAEWTAILINSAPVPVPAPPAPAPTPTHDPTPPAPPVLTDPRGQLWDCSTTDSIVNALAVALPGDTVQLRSGFYVNRHRFTAINSGTADKHITLKALGGATLSTGSTSGEYGLWMLGSYWDVLDLGVTQATKGVVLDGAAYVQLARLHVYEIGQEGVHFRSGSHDGVLQGSLVERTGLKSPQFGEGAYVGSAISNWGTSQTHPKTGKPIYYGENGGKGPDRADRVQIVNNTFRDIAAEGLDYKEGSSYLQAALNTFDNCGFSGKNSADSMIDLKGYAALVRGNTLKSASGALLNGIETHVFNTPGSGSDNVIEQNVLEGEIPGYFVYLAQGTGNVVRADNHAPGAKLGLVGANKKRIEPNG